MNRFAQVLIIFSASFLVLACAKPRIDDDIPLAWRVQVLNDIFPDEITRPISISELGISINFSDTIGWRSLSHEAKAFKFVKEIDQKSHHTAAIVAYQVFPPRTKFENLDDFFNNTKLDLENLRDKNGKDIELSIEPNNEKAPMCVSFHYRKYAVDEKNIPGKPLILEAYEFICKHPSRSNTFLNLHYSEQFLASDNITDVYHRADTMLKSMTFSN